MSGADYVIVIAAASRQRVPAAEFHPRDCIKTNLRGAENASGATRENAAEKALALATHPAANRINLEGATGPAANQLLVAANNLAGGRISPGDTAPYTERNHRHSTVRKMHEIMPLRPMPPR